MIPIVHAGQDKEKTAKVPIAIRLAAREGSTKERSVARPIRRFLAFILRSITHGTRNPTAKRMPTVAVSRRTVANEVRVDPACEMKSATQVSIAGPLNLEARPKIVVPHGVVSSQP